MPMNIGDVRFLSGCFTQEKFIAGRKLVDIERSIGFHAGRLSKGGIVFAFLGLPEVDQFEVAGYSMVATHRFVLSPGLDPKKLKGDARKGWSLTGGDRLVKVRPAIEHDSGMNPDFQYPHALGIPQWVLKVALPAKVTAVLGGYPDGVYRPGDVAKV
jgi:hypothetical protein